MKISARMKPVSLVLALSLGLAVPATTSIAGGSDWMNDYFNSAGAGMNVTPAAVYESQSQTTMSLGGFAYRAPQRATQLFSFSPPGYKAGCGGIDAWLGAYGFVNMDQFVAALRNIGQNAVGYFFQLALKTMAPEIDGLLTDLSKTINQLNQFQIGSCQLIKQYVGDVPAAKKDMDFQQRAELFGSALTGAYGSFFNSKEAQKTSPADTKAAYDAGCATSTALLCKDSNGNPVLRENLNIVYDAMQRTGAYTTQEIELYISLLGTLTFTKNTSDVLSAFSTTYFAPTIVWQDFLGPIAGTHTMAIRECPNSDCVPYTSASDTGTPRATTGMTAVVYALLHKMKDAVVTRTRLTDPKALQLMAMSSTPVYQMIVQSIHAGRGSTVVADRIIDSFAEIVATELVLNQIRDITKAVEEALTKTEAASVSADIAAIKQFKTSLLQSRNEALVVYAQKQAAASDKIKNMVALLDFQRQLYTSLGPRLTSNIEFGQKM